MNIFSNNTAIAAGRLTSSTRYPLSSAQTAVSAARTAVSAALTAAVFSLLFLGGCAKEED
ncbi:MAG: hypothetical protein M3Y08_19430 [Fibrobacterota bacterium]|nr:hypothetical protein [Fibrobacterota bacterium]